MSNAKALFPRLIIALAIIALGVCVAISFGATLGTVLALATAGSSVFAGGLIASQHVKFRQPPFDHEPATLALAKKFLDVLIGAWLSTLLAIASLCNGAPFLPALLVMNTVLAVLIFLIETPPGKTVPKLTQVLVGISGPLVTLLWAAIYFGLRGQLH